ncbi:MAG: ketoacyl-ACP synthase III [Chloroflexi bacterium]|nr:ketoacyl-ACP synthase III [Chloroflexota bacterium]
MQTRYGRIIGWGSYVPEKVVTNYDLEKTLDTSHEWIVQRTGIHQRFIAAAHETAATMSVEAGRRALERANLPAEELDLIIVATTTGDHLTPPVSSQVQHMLGATNVPAFVLVTGCTGFLYGLATAQQFISSGVYKNILVIGTELLSRFLDWKDRNTCVLFGDASGAFVIQATTEPCGLYGFDMGSDGSGHEHIIAHAAGSAEPISATTFAQGRQYIRMNGREVFKFATRILGKTSKLSLARSGLSIDDIDCIVPHQANLRIIQAASRSMNVPMSRFLVKVHKYANTSAASIPVAICDSLDSGEIKLEDRLLVVSFGAGLTWASGVLQMAPITQAIRMKNRTTVPKVVELVAA